MNELHARNAGYHACPLNLTAEGAPMRPLEPINVHSPRGATSAQKCPMCGMIRLLRGSFVGHFFAPSEHYPVIPLPPTLNFRARAAAAFARFPVRVGALALVVLAAFGCEPTFDAQVKYCTESCDRAGMHVGTFVEGLPCCCTAGRVESCESAGMQFGALVEGPHYMCTAGRIDGGAR